jgi:hypothetical protein
MLLPLLPVVVGVVVAGVVLGPEPPAVVVVVLVARLVVVDVGGSDFLSLLHAATSTMRPITITARPRMQ